jgi:uncharacterized protein YaaQ
MDNSNSTPTPINLMMIAVVQAQDADIAHSALQKAGINLVRLPSIGAFLGRRNATLLLGIPREDHNRITHILEENCRQRIEYIAVPLESAPLPLPAPTPITIGGATIFAVEVEHYEEI